MKIPKVLAMYLPQFHRVKENDEWWGEGFTEWNAVKAAQPLYPGHEQPVHPLEYYDLLDKDVMLRQAEYMKQYGVDGMCFYHYYFDRGRRILEKPAENLLAWTDINMPFCFCWANDSWIRSWSNVSGNSWTEIFEPDKQNEMESVLLKQNYGGRKEWEEHFYYLLPFFHDARYLKKDGRPIFLIYNPTEIEELMEIKQCWNELMEKEGMPHIFFIGKGSKGEALDGMLIHEPIDAWGEFWQRAYQNDYGIHYLLNYDEVWERILSKRYADKNIYLGGFTGFDDSPRRGRKGIVIYGGTPEKFRRYLMRLLLKAGNMDSEFVFINAWNEWGEGMHLEPDEKWGFGYLEAVRSAKKFVEDYGDIVEDSWSDNLPEAGSNGSSEEIHILSVKNERYRGYWKTLKRWLDIQLQGKTVCEYFNKNRYNKVAIYGLGILGSSLVDEMRNHNIRIAYGIDQDEHKGKKFDFPVYRLQDELPEADVIVITVGYAFESIKPQIMKRKKCEVVSLNTLLDCAEQLS